MHSLFFLFLSLVAMGIEIFSFWGIFMKSVESFLKQIQEVVVIKNCKSRLIWRGAPPHPTSPTPPSSHNKTPMPTQEHIAYCRTQSSTEPWHGYNRCRVLGCLVGSSNCFCWYNEACKIGFSPFYFRFSYFTFFSCIPMCNCIASSSGTLVDFFNHKKFLKIYPNILNIAMEFRSLHQSWILSFNIH